uniref:C-type lectin (CTL) n=3 Tax=gambiae species complex TaxID=44542 RepID=A0A1S4GAH1_ANOGA|nr:integrator complex subunit 6 homolog [Anopheles coluzzii]XP_040239984.2 integrator complex subunit 6 homolog [Anopheles coluzzii]XP_040239992.2 integrator complex subunit 6 homolog [Anopheles coluzzii]XP_040239998.2 integrator complex subunit 6 homolog [Anopheles coluzzii]XP_040240006.2 integrator complex subunit 6 homolog [Anopheles coluzzii]
MAKLLLSFALAILTVGSIDSVESRAVNISNTWTLPQEGFSVFYRYFRDKISWFEADAVCQFHHANLVTVDNGVQFDATRAFLKELDVTSAVWIGLMRPENSARFTWTSSKALDPSSGYWAEAIPAMEQPLCAVVDPVRDFRWHALRCGGPETAAFLCELPVPTWAVDCTVTSIPSLTVQYMSDSGTVQLSRDCGESGTKHISCQGKQDRDSIIEQLQCSDEEDLASVLATENNNQLPGVESAATASSTRRPQQQPILEHDILTVVSNNDEESNNKIEVNPNQIEDTVKNVINKFNLQDLMRSEQAAALHSEEVDGHGAESVRKSGYAKKYSPLYEKKNHYAKKNVNGSERNESADEEEEDEDEPMLGDQPLPDETETQPIDIIQQAVKPTSDGDYADSAVVSGGVKIGNEEPAGVVGVTTPETGTTPDSRLRRGTDSDREEDTVTKMTEPVSSSSTASGVTEVTTTSSTAAPTAVPSLSPTVTSTPAALLTTRTTAASHILPTTPKKEVITGDHFIPPMLLVKARFISARPQTEAPPTTVLPTASSTSLPVDLDVSDPTITGLVTSELSLTEDETKLEPSPSSASIATESAAETTPIASTDAHHVVQVVFESSESGRSESAGSLTITTRPFSAVDTTHAPMVVDPSAPQSAALVATIQLTQYSDSITSTAVPELDTIVHSSAAPKMSFTSSTEDLDITTVAPETVEANVSSKTNPSVSPPATVAPSTMVSTPDQEFFSSSSDPNTTPGVEDSSSHDVTTAMPSTSPKLEPSEQPAGEASGVKQQMDGIEDHHNDRTHEEHEEEEDEHEEHSELHNSFSNVENYQPYKPNRHRALTKPEVHNNHGAYIKKILG